MHLCLRLPPQVWVHRSQLQTSWTITLLFPIVYLTETLHMHQFSIKSILWPFLLYNQYNKQAPESLKVYIVFKISLLLTKITWGTQKCEWSLKLQFPSRIKANNKMFHLDFVYWPIAIKSCHLSYVDKTYNSSKFIYIICMYLYLTCTVCQIRCQVYHILRGNSIVKPLEPPPHKKRKYQAFVFKNDFLHVQKILVKSRILRGLLIFK